MNTRIPRQLIQSGPRLPLLAHHPAGGARLNVPVYASLPGQLARIHRRGVSIDLHPVAPVLDDFLEPHPAGGVRLKLT